MSDDGGHPHDEPRYRGRTSQAAGRLIGGRYRLTERVGSGGMGTVWKAVDELVDREVAVKQPKLPGDTDDPDGPENEARQRAANRLHREARAAARVDHPSAVTIHDVVVEDGLPWIVMELVRGESLHEVLKRGALTPAESARIGLAVVGALHTAHGVGIVHRDVKPANVLLGPHGQVVLTDFGIAHVQGEESLTMTGEFVGSLEFVAPERMSGPGAAGPPSDLWSLGVLLYAAVEGWSPFRRTTLESTLAAILSTEPPEPERAGPSAPWSYGCWPRTRRSARTPRRPPGSWRTLRRSGHRTLRRRPTCGSWAKTWGRYGSAVSRTVPPYARGRGRTYERNAPGRKTYGKRHRKRHRKRVRKRVRKRHARRAPRRTGGRRARNRGRTIRGRAAAWQAACRSARRRHHRDPAGRWGSLGRGRSRHGR